MDESDPEIEFFDDGTCNHCRQAIEQARRRTAGNGEAAGRLAAIVAEVKERHRNRAYDCVLGVSGGVDSSYAAFLAKRRGLRTLLVHFDNGWNTEIAVGNIERLVRGLEFDLETYVIDWLEFRDLQRAFFAAHVVDIELLTDQAIAGVMFRSARRWSIRCILSGANSVTESIMPRTWLHPKGDWTNIRAIHRAHGELPMRTYPGASAYRSWSQRVLRRVTTLPILELVPYDKRTAMEELRQEVGWRPYGGKHHESVFTRFYQAHILPRKFGFDKRKSHLSNLICDGQITRDEALRQLAEPLYDEGLLRHDLDFVEKKLGFTPAELEQYLTAPGRSHYDYRSSVRLVAGLVRLRNAVLRRQMSPRPG